MKNKPDPNAVRLAFISWWKHTENTIDNVLLPALKTPGHPLFKCLTAEEREGAIVALGQCSDRLTSECPLPPSISTGALLAAMEA